MLFTSSEAAKEWSELLRFGHKACRNSNVVLWHPDREFFLLGKRITSEWLADLTVPV